jgi:hypothetical protein
MFTSLFVFLASALCVFAFPTGNLTTTLATRQVNARYIWTAFTAASESNLYVYTSSDATTWSLLAGPTYTPSTGLIRDPSVLYHTESVKVVHPAHKN